MRPIFLINILFVSVLFLNSCKDSKETKTITNTIESNSKEIAVNQSYFLKNRNFEMQTVDCTLSDGTKTQCLKITTKSVPADHETGPWCPEKITDTAEKGGVWFKDGKLYDVDGEFIKNLPELYEDEKWLLHDENGNVLKTNSKDDCLELKGAQLVEKFVNYCIECLPEYTKDITRTFMIPLHPVKLEKPISLGKPAPNGKPKQGDGPPPSRPEGGKGGGAPNMRGVAFNGVVFDGPAPLHIILNGYTIPALDDAGGHVNLDQGYHYHATTGKIKNIKQTDGHASMIGYALDGYGLFTRLNENSSEPTDLDECRGHSDLVRGYHYHVDEAGNNNFINCFSGAIAQ